MSSIAEIVQSTAKQTYQETVRGVYEVMDMRIKGARGNKDKIQEIRNETVKIVLRVAKIYARESASEGNKTNMEEAFVVMKSKAEKLGWGVSSEVASDIAQIRGSLLICDSLDLQLSVAS